MKKPAKPRAVKPGRAWAVVHKRECEIRPWRCFATREYARRYIGADVTEWRIIRVRIVPEEGKQ